MSAAYMSAVNAPHLVLGLNMRGDHMVLMGYNALGTWFVRSFFLLEDGTLDLRAVVRLTSSSVCCLFIFISCWSSSRLAYPT
jgi:hypothetical protein